MKALVLSGGGSKAATQLSIVKELLKTNNYDIIAGNSAGALNAAILVSGDINDSLKKLEHLWLNEIKSNDSIKNHNILWKAIGLTILSSGLALSSFSSSLFLHNLPLTLMFGILFIGSLYLHYLGIKHSDSIYSTKPLENIIKKYVNLDNIKKSGKKLRIGSVSLETGEYRVLDENNENLHKWLLASSAYPMFFPAVKIDNLHWIDGGIIDSAPVNSAIEAGATEVDVVLTTPININFYKKRGFLTQVTRAIEIMLFELLKNDILNRGILIKIYAPKNSVDIDILDFSPKSIKSAYEAGKDFEEIIITKDINL